MDNSFNQAGFRNPDASQCGHSACIFSQRPFPPVEGSPSVLCPPRHRSKVVVPRVFFRRSDEIRRFATSLRGNVDIVDEPLRRKEGANPAWNDAEIDDVIAFLKTLSDRSATLPNN